MYQLFSRGPRTQSQTQHVIKNVAPSEKRNENRTMNTVNYKKISLLHQWTTDGEKKKALAHKRQNVLVTENVA